MNSSKEHDAISKCNLVEQHWREISQWLDTNAPELAEIFGTPTAGSKRSKKAIRKAIRSVGYALPDEYVHWINQCADGQPGGLHRGIIPNLDGKGSFAFGDIRLMCDYWGRTCERFENTKRNVTTCPGIQETFLDPYWFSFAVDESNNRGDRLAFDMNPDTPGTQGQVIFWSTKGFDRFVVCETFEELLRRVNDGLRLENLIYDEAIGTITNKPPFEFLGSAKIVTGFRPPRNTQVSELAKARLTVRGDVSLVNRQHNPIANASFEGLDGFDSIDEMGEYLDDSGIESRVKSSIVGGGEIRLGLDVQSKMPYCETAFELSRELTELEQTTLVEFVLDQWSDGAGECLAVDGIDEGFLLLCPDRNPTVTIKQL